MAKVSKRILSLAMALVMVFTLLLVSALAEGEGKVEITLKQDWGIGITFSNGEELDVIIDDVKYSGTVQVKNRTCKVVVENVSSTDAAFATVVKEVWGFFDTYEYRAVANLTWNGTSATGTTGGWSRAVGTQTFKLYYIYTNELPNPLATGGNKENYGPSGNDIPFVEVTIDVDALLAHYGKAGLEDITPVTCGMKNADGNVITKVDCKIKLDT